MTTPRLLAAALILAAAIPAGADEPGACSAESAAKPGQARDTVEATRPGPWRQDAKRVPPRLRVPGTRTVAPKDRMSFDATAAGRWVRGYRPATPEAEAAFEAWKAAQAAHLGTADLSGVPNQPTSNFAANLLRGGRAGAVADETIEHVVRDARYSVSPVDLRRLAPPEETVAKPKGKKPESDTGYDHHSGLTWSEYRWVKAQAQDAPETRDGQEAVASSSRAPGAGGVGFDAIVSNQTYTPPDPILAAGPGHLVAVVNSRYQVWDKTGTPLSTPIPLEQFFNGVPHCAGLFDPYVDYDEASNRFVMGAMSLETGAGTNSYLCVAASATNDPTGTWNRISFRADVVDPLTWIDYPHMGIGLDAIYIAGNMFLDGGGLDSVRAFAVDKAALYAGTAVGVAEAGLGSMFFTAQPAKLHGYASGGWPAPGTPHHLIAHDGGGNSRIWRWSDPFASPPVIYGTLTEAYVGSAPPSAAELGAGVAGLNDTGTGRWLDAEVRAGKLWATRNTACNFGGGNAESCIDWVEIDVSGTAPVLLQQQSGGAYGSTGDFRYYPDLSIDRNGNVAIGYTKSSAATYTQVWVTGREFGDPPGTLQPEVLQRAGLGNYNDGGGCGGSCDRWGDYTGMTVDPDGCTFWYLGQYSDGGYYNWGTRIGNFRFASCSTDSLVQVDKGTYTCDDTIEVTVTDTVAIDAATVADRTTVATTAGDAETIPAGSWTGSDCAGTACGTWTATMPVLGTAGADGDGVVNAGDGQTITVLYTDPHAGHATRSVEAAVGCRTRLEDGGYLTTGGCEAGTGAEVYRDYMDGGEFIAYTFGVYNPPTATPLTDVVAELVITGPAADRITIFNPIVQLGSIGTDQLTAPVFSLYISPTIDAAGLRMSEHAFNLRVTSAADGFTTAQTLTQRHLLQTDDTIVAEGECWNFESGAQGFVEDRIRYQYTCGPAACGTQTQVSTVAAPFSRGAGCGSEIRTDDPGISCDTGGTQAFKSNGDPATCGAFAQSKGGGLGTITDTVLYSPIFRPAHTGLAANGQPWNYEWLGASWYYRSDMVAFIDPAMAVGFFWDRNYPGTDTPGINEIYDWYPYAYGYFFYENRGWDGGTPWDPLVGPANRDGIGFGNARGAATAGLQWRWAIEVYDTDMDGDPTATPATAGLALDNLNFAYNQYHADGQVGTCSASNAVVTFDRYTYPQCPGQAVGIRVFDGSTAGSVQVTVESETTGDLETFTLHGTGPDFAATLPSSTADGPRANDGTLLVAPSDRIRATYHGDSGPYSVAYAYVDCRGGDVVADGIAGLADNGDGDAWADANETVHFSIKLRNNTGQPLQNVRAIVDSDDPSVDCLRKNTASFGTIAAGATATNPLATDPFTFKVSGSVACTDPMAPPTATFRVLILADGFAGPLEPQEVTLFLDLNDVPGTTTYLEPFTTNPTGFVHRLGPGDDDGATVNPSGSPCSPYADRFFWRATGGNSGGGYFCWQNQADNFPTGNYGDLSDSVLYSPVLKIGTTGTTLSFDHEYLFGYSGTYRVDGARVDYRINGGVWRKLTTLPYDGALIFNHYCNPLCNMGGEYNRDCFSENAANGENIFNQLDQGTVNWRAVSGALSGLNPGDLVQFRWRVGSMRSSSYGISTAGGYGLDNVSLTGVVQRTCDAAVRPDVGCGVVFDRSGNLVQRCGDGDALVEPTERWAVDVTLRNSAATPSVGTTAELAISAGSRNPATVVGNPASFGTIAAAGGTATATYEFVVGPGAACIEEVLFDLRNVADVQGSYGDAPSVFSVPVGGTGSQQTATQSLDPLSASDSTGFSALAPALGVPTPVYGATVDYDFAYTNVAPVQSESQVVNPLTVENATITTLLGDPFAISPDSAVSAVVDWTTLSHSSVTDCTRVFLQTPSGSNWTLKAIGAAPANPYNVLTVYKNSSGGAGQYRIGLEEVASGPCKNQASLTGATMTVTDAAPTGTWTANARVSLWDGTRAYVLKPFGAADAAPYDVKASYDAGGPGNWSIRLEENGGGGEARLAAASLTAVGIQCDAGCAVSSPAAPPMADGEIGAPVLFGKGLGPDELTVSIDNATCSSSRAVVLYGSIGNYAGYQGAVTGCDLGAGPIGTITAPAGSVWFNVIWVNDAGAAGHPGFSSSGARTWPAAGLCGSISDDASDAVCN
ncbi:MAG TPA: hypothetical protein VF139_17755 [Candidatus Polarisedimenticolaceae bacterium]